MNGILFFSKIYTGIVKLLVRFGPRTLPSSVSLLPPTGRCFPPPLDLLESQDVLVFENLDMTG